MDIQLILLIVGLILAFLMAFNIGGNDACNPVSPAIGAGAITLRRAFVLFGIFTILGASLQGFMVMKTIGSGIVPQIDIIGAIIIVITAIVWIFLATMLGMNISTGHSLIAAVIGYGIVQYSISGLNVAVIQSIIISWITSPLSALLLAFIIFKLISSYISKHQNDVQKLERIFKYALIATLCFASYSFGANDVSHATGVYIKITADVLGAPDAIVMLFLSIFGAVGMVLGGLLIGRKVIETMAFRVTNLDLITALSASLANAIVVYLFVTVPYILIGYGLPISSSYAVVGAIVGAGMARSMKSVSKKTTLTLIGYWILTIPVCISICAGLYLLVGYIF